MHTIPRSGQPMSRTVTPRLSPAEQRVAELVAEGLTNKQIAQRLYVSDHTVRTHIVHAMDKLGLHSRMQLALHLQADQQHPGSYAVSWIDAHGMHTTVYPSWPRADAEFCRRRDMTSCYRVRIAAEDGTR